jgi:hypothetical protein
VWLGRQRVTVYNHVKIACYGVDGPIVYSGGTTPVYNRRQVSDVATVNIRAKGERLHWPVRA